MLATALMDLPKVADFLANAMLQLCLKIEEFLRKRQGAACFFACLQVFCESY